MNTEKNSTPDRGLPTPPPPRDPHPWRGLKPQATACPGGRQAAQTASPLKTPLMRVVIRRKRHV